MSDRVSNHFLSPPQRPLCVVGRLGRKKKRARGARWEGGREKRGPPFPSSHRPPRAFYFFDYFILMGIPSGSLCGGERIIFYIGEITSFMYFYTLALATQFKSYVKPKQGNDLIISYSMRFARISQSLLKSGRFSSELQPIKLGTLNTEDFFRTNV